MHGHRMPLKAVLLAVLVACAAASDAIGASVEGTEASAAFVPENIITTTTAEQQTAEEEEQRQSVATVHIILGPTEPGSSEQQVIGVIHHIQLNPRTLFGRKFGPQSQSTTQVDAQQPQTTEDIFSPFFAHVQRLAAIEELHDRLLASVHCPHMRQRMLDQMMRNSLGPDNNEENNDDDDDDDDDGFDVMHSRMMHRPFMGREGGMHHPMHHHEHPMMHDDHPLGLLMMLRHNVMNSHLNNNNNGNNFDSVDDRVDGEGDDGFASSRGGWMPFGGMPAQHHRAHWLELESHSVISSSSSEDNQPSFDFSAINWGLFENDGSLNWNLVMFSALTGGCVVVWSALLMQCFAFWGMDDYENYNTDSEEDDESYSDDDDSRHTFNGRNGYRYTDPKNYYKHTTSSMKEHYRRFLDYDYYNAEDDNSSSKKLTTGDINGGKNVDDAVVKGEEVVVVNGFPVVVEDASSYMGNGGGGKDVKREMVTVEYMPLRGEM